MIAEPGPRSFTFFHTRCGFELLVALVTAFDNESNCGSSSQETWQPSSPFKADIEETVLAEAGDGDAASIHGVSWHPKDSLLISRDSKSEGSGIAFN